MTFTQAFEKSNRSSCLNNNFHANPTKITEHFPSVIYISLSDSLQHFPDYIAETQLWLSLRTAGDITPKEASIDVHIEHVYSLIIIIKTQTEARMILDADYVQELPKTLIFCYSHTKHVLSLPWKLTHFSSTFERITQAHSFGFSLLLLPLLFYQVKNDALSSSHVTKRTIYNWWQFILGRP